MSVFMSILMMKRSLLFRIIVSFPVISVIKVDEFSSIEILMVMSSMISNKARVIRM